MAWVLGHEAGLDTGRLLKIMLVHDLPEAKVGDATPYAQFLGSGGGLADAVPHWRELVTPEQLAAARRQKRSLEEEAVAVLVSELPTTLGDELQDLWLDYVERRSPEARFAAQIDKLEAALQAIEYRDAGDDADVANFLRTAQEAVDHPLLLELLDELKASAGS